MKILIVEDDDYKCDKIVDHLSTVCPDSNITIKKSYKSGLLEILSCEYDLIILDMSLPTFDMDIHGDGGRPQAFAGRDLLMQMERKGKTQPVLVVTQFDHFGEGSESFSLDELKIVLKKEHLNYVDTVYYSTTTDSWKSEMSKLVKSLLEHGDD